MRALVPLQVVECNLFFQMMCQKSRLRWDELLAEYVVDFQIYERGALAEFSGATPPGSDGATLPKLGEGKTSEFPKPVAVYRGGERVV
jgi:hypothetical protein